MARIPELLHFLADTTFSSRHCPPLVGFKSLPTKTQLTFGGANFLSFFEYWNTRGYQIWSIFRNTCFSILTCFYFAQKPYVSLPKIEKTCVSKNTPLDLVKWTYFLVTLQNEVRMHGCTSACFTSSHWCRVLHYCVSNEVWMRGCATACFPPSLSIIYLITNMLYRTKCHLCSKCVFRNTCFLNAPKWGVQKREKHVKIEKHVFLKTLQI